MPFRSVTSATNITSWTAKAFHQIRQKNYDAFGEGITPENLFPSAPEHIVDLKPSLSEASDVFLKLLPY
ncbi:hypothetical protein OH492_12455 [Vibrio chagasii]|nr:hypothetical protein [Vibrio chagasii]